MPASPVFHGSLLSRSFMSGAHHDGEVLPGAGFLREFRRLCREAARMRAAEGARALADRVAIPLAALFGFEVRRIQHAAGAAAEAALCVAGRAVALLLVHPGGRALEAMRLEIVSVTRRRGLRWCFSVTREEVALVDCARPHARRWLAADLQRCAAQPATLPALAAVFGARAFDRRGDEPTPLEMMIARSEADLQGVRASLQKGVERAALALTSALSSRAGAPSVPGLFEEALTVVYRILFLQFAEARGLVPVWHPTYRKGYTIEALREALESGGEAHGVWETLQAIARLAHRGAKAGELIVTPFNGRLFSPSQAPSVARGHVPDLDAATALSALTLTEDGRGRRRRIPFIDLGVEQLGSIYERVLDFVPARDERTGRATLQRGGLRKSTGTFYTPRTITEFIVRRTLAPLVQAAAPDQILSLRVVDAAMGSGAFLVAACRYLARAYEASLREAGIAGADDLSPRDRAGFRRLIAQRCLYGVDLHPMAVQLGRLSLWLCSLAADKPLTFLDHRLRVGNSLLGSSLDAVLARAPGGRFPIQHPTLFGDAALESIGRASNLRREMALTPDDSIEEVRRKEGILAELDSAGGPLALWRRICDTWCAAWFWPDRATAPSAKNFAALCDAIRGDGSFSHPAVGSRVATAAAIARERRFFHWPLEFPEVFEHAGHAGFDAMIGNPPWDMLRGDAGSRAVVRFTRESGSYRLQSAGHSNAYQLFLERTLQLVRAGGRFGLVLPWGLATDEGSARLRRELLDRCTLDDLVVLDNGDAIFPIHRSLKFAVVCATAGGRSDAVRYQAGIRDAGTLDSMPDTGAPRPSAPHAIEIARELLERSSGPSLAVPHLSSQDEVRLLDRLTRAAPPVSSRDGWGVRFGRELNASDDRSLFSSSPSGYPVIAGRDIAPFRVDTARSGLRIHPDAAARRLGDAVNRHRLAYRDVSGAGNRVTLIAAIVPPRVVTTHTVFCLKTRLGLAEQMVLCALLNSYVTNYLVRMRIGTHVTTALVHALPVPRPARGSAAFSRIAAHTRSAAAGILALPALEAEVAALYGLDRNLFRLILASFPLVPATDREAALTALGGT